MARRTFFLIKVSESSGKYLIESKQLVNAAVVAMNEFSKCEIILGDSSHHPHCAHGPSVLFSRNGKRFFACSAYRSRQLCPFYLEAENFEKNQSKKKQSKNKKVSSFKDNAHEHEARLRNLANPENNQGQAQFYFSEGTLAFLMTSLRKLKSKNILCLGTPSIHEKFKESSYLLDIDRKFETSAENFARYNMCNHYFFGDTYNYRNHLKTSSTLMVLCDPPFGARLELLLSTFNKIESEWKKFENRKSIHFMLINPYFVEGKLQKLDPRFHMSDYRIEYASHKKFKKGDKSPVRIYTTMNLSKLPLPEVEYKYCSVCQKYVFRISKHCKHCGSCDSRDGKEYNHCDDCQRCVKNTWSHCSTCKTCHLRGECEAVPRKRKVS